MKTRLSFAGLPSLPSRGEIVPPLPIFALSGLLRLFATPVLRLLFALLFVGVLTVTVYAAGVVTVPTEAALDAALQGGGLVTFACDGTIPITRIKWIRVATSLDAAGHNITLKREAERRNCSLSGTQAPATAAILISLLA